MIWKRGKELSAQNIASAEAVQACLPLHQKYVTYVSNPSATHWL